MLKRLAHETVCLEFKKDPRKISVVSRRQWTASVLFPSGRVSSQISKPFLYRRFIIQHLFPLDWLNSFTLSAIGFHA